MTKIIYPSQLGTYLGCNKYHSKLTVMLKHFKLKKDKISKYQKKCNIIGVRHESRIISIFSTQYNLKCYKVDKQSSSINNWVIRGKCDGITSKGHLIEIKCRENKIHQDITEMDYAQVQAYLHIYNMDYCYYIQCLHNDNNIDVQIIKKNIDYWFKKVVPKINEFNEIYEKLDECFKKLSPRNELELNTNQSSNQLSIQKNE